jgi:hypothetical protein
MLTFICDCPAPHLKKTWCWGELDALFLARMEQLLYLYALPHEERFPVVCFEERPCFLIGERVEGLGEEGRPSGARA